MTPWAQMWIIAFTIYAGCKLLTWHSAAASSAPAWKRVAYLFAWPGMDAADFTAVFPQPRCTRCGSSEWLRAFGTLTGGVALLFGVARLMPVGVEYLTGWIGMLGMVLMLHFGAFHLLSCFWRGQGVAARPVMDRPLESTSLAEFWGRRWNTAFRDLTHQFLFVPLAKKFGVRGAIMAGFLFSGVIHDLVISLPAGGGYGRPTAFFAIQGAAMLIERSALGKTIGLGAGSRGRAFTMTALLVPAVLLFHPPFVIGIVIPFMRAIGAL